MKHLLAWLLVFIGISGNSFADNYALTFTPSQWAITQTPGPLTTLTNNFTFECWLRWDGTNAGIDKYVFFNGNPSFRGHALYVLNGTQNIIILYGGVVAFSTGVTLTANVPTHIALVRNAGTSQIYINGAAVGGTTTVPPNAPTIADGFSLGNFGGAVSFPGQIDNFRIWGAALSPATVQAWMGQEVLTGHPNLGSLIANYPMNEGTGQTTASVGGSNPITLFLGSSAAVEAADPTWSFSSFPAPTVTEWGMIIMAFSLVGVALWKLPISSLSRA